MKPDDEICYCFHVSLRKLTNYARRESPTRPSQMSDCLSAGTGCGWCIPILKMIHARADGNFELRENEDMPGLPKTSTEYEAARKRYLKSDRKNSFD